MAFGLAGLSKPTWLSLIWRKVSPAGCGGLCCEPTSAQRAGHAAGNGPQHAGARPGHAFQHPAAADARGIVIVVVIGFAHDKSPWTLDWVSTGLIGRGRDLFPDQSRSCDRRAMTFS